MHGACQFLDCAYLTLTATGEIVMDPSLVVTTAAAAGQAAASAYRNRKRIRQLFRGSPDELQGEWRQYHLTRDTLVGAGEMWVPHDETFKVTRSGKISGTSVNDHSTAMSYRISGTAGPEIVMGYENRNTDSEPGVHIRIMDRIRGDLLVGFWNGYDFDQRPFAGPIIYSRHELLEPQLNHIVATEHLTSAHLDPPNGNGHTFAA